MRHTFERVDPDDAALTVRLSDTRGGFLRSHTRLLGEATIHCSHIKVGCGGCHANSWEWGGEGAADRGGGRAGAAAK